MYNGFPEYVSLLEKRGLLRRVGVSVSGELEIAAIAQRTCRLPDGGPALLFEKINGSEFPIMINSYGSAERIAWAFSVGKLAQLTERVEELFKPGLSQGLGIRQFLFGESSELNKYTPRQIKSAVCQEVSEVFNPSFRQLPFLRWNVSDSDVSLRRAVLLYADSTTGKQKMVSTGLLILDNRQALLVEPKGDLAITKPTEAAIIIGEDPSLLAVAHAALPLENDGLALAGFMRRARYEIVKGLKVGLDIPSGAEFVLEGVLEPYSVNQTRTIALSSGYYHQLNGGAISFQLSAISHRRNPLWVDVIAAQPPQEEAQLIRVSERMLLPFVKAVAPEIVNINLAPGNARNGIALVSIQKSYPGQAQKVMYALWGMTRLRELKYIIVVDADCNLHDYAAIAWSVCNRVSLSRDLLVVNGPLSTTDRFSHLPGMGSKIGIDSTHKLPGEVEPNQLLFVPELPYNLVKLIDEKWASFGID
ncbi:UbiD family decarboxylase domain-containing protein [Candidatus Chlorohelix sp.]|uniref:UbiD family decarboxylase domain-containing protein n=1 Tax=Candidatus Chlorohelix sp. TaxID=3139201 RepID=UPI0030362EA3